MTVFDLDRGREVLAFARIGRIRNAVLTLCAVRDTGRAVPRERPMRRPLRQAWAQ